MKLHLLAQLLQLLQGWLWCSAAPIAVGGRSATEMTNFDTAVSKFVNASRRRQVHKWHTVNGSKIALQSVGGDARGVGT
jgi:hypothetical protein